jgi:uncharacterized protein
MSRVIHFEIHAENPARAIKFYEQVLGWKFNKWEGPQDYWLITTGPKDQLGIDGGLVPRRGKIDGEGVIAFVCTIDVDSVDDIAKKVENSNGLVVVPKMPVPGIGWLAYCKDTEGNIFGVMQNDSGAK